MTDYYKHHTLKYIVHIMTFIFTLGGLSLSAQTKLNVVTKEKSETIDWLTGVSLVITGERSEISVTAHDKNTIEYAVQFISKHPELDQAKKEVDYHQWVSDRIGKKIYLRNYIQLSDANEKPKGNLKTIYKVKVPKNCPVSVQNYFGKIDLEGLSGEINIQSDFAKVFLTDIDAQVDIQSKFGDVTANRLDGNIKIVSNRGDLFLNDIGGRYDLDVSTAQVVFGRSFLAEEMKLKTLKTNVTFRIEELSQINFEAIVDQVELQLPEWMPFQTETIKGKKQKLTCQQNSNTSIFQFDLHYGKLEMRNEVGSN